MEPDELSLQAVAAKYTPEQLKLFIQIVREIVDRVAQTPAALPTVDPAAGTIDYATAPAIDTSAGPPGGWLTKDDVRVASAKMIEAVAAEKWTDGFVFAVKLFVAAGGAI